MESKNGTFELNINLGEEEQTVTVEKINDTFYAWYYTPYIFNAEALHDMHKALSKILTDKTVVALPDTTRITEMTMQELDDTINYLEEIKKRLIDKNEKK